MEDALKCGLGACVSFANVTPVVISDLVTWCKMRWHQAADLQLQANVSCLERDVYCGVSVGDGGGLPATGSFSFWWSWSTHCDLHWVVSSGTQINNWHMSWRRTAARPVHVELQEQMGPSVKSGSRCGRRKESGGGKEGSEEKTSAFPSVHVRPDDHTGQKSTIPQRL